MHRADAQMPFRDGEGGDAGALIIRLGFWSPLYYICSKEPPKIVKVTIKAPILGVGEGETTRRRRDRLELM